MRSVQRALSLLCVFDLDSPRLTLSEIAHRTGLAVSTTARLLGTLESMCFLRRFDDASYGLGSRVLQLGIVARQGFDLIDSALPLLERLNEVTGENSNLAVRSGERHFTYVRQLPTRHAVRHATWVGKEQPLEGTANGAALLGRVDPRGWVSTRDTIEADVSAVAAPVRGLDGEIVASLSVAGPTYRIDDACLDRYGRLVAEAADELSRIVCAHANLERPVANAANAPSGRALAR